MKLNSKLLSLAFSSALLISTAANAANALNVYGPGGPAPAMKEIASAFTAEKGIAVNVIAGPTSQWVAVAKTNADVLFSGAENMMSDFAKALPDTFSLTQAEPIYLRPAAILVRPGNPKGIHGLRDALKPGVKILTVAGAGQVGLWEDVAGRTGDIDMVKSFRRNMILPEAPNSAAAKEQWIEHPEIDVWLIWNIWQVANPQLAQVVDLEPEFRIYRDAGIVLTKNASDNADAKAFIGFVKSDAGRAIFKKWGWR
jgi:accessory colonization factor AcfC